MKDFTVTQNNVRVPGPAPCPFSEVEVISKLVINNAPHAGVITHRCSRPVKHTGEPCRCACGHEWKGWA